jgi:hypothetical protein
MEDAIYANPIVAFAAIRSIFAEPKLQAMGDAAIRDTLHGSQVIACKQAPTTQHRN